MNKDYVTLMPRKRDVIRGDVVMFHDSIRERYVLHRVWKINEDNVLTWGDNCFNPDGWMKSDQVWGLAIRVERGKLNIKCDQSGMRKLGILVGHLRHAYIRIRRPFYLLVSKVLPKPVKEWLKRIFK